MILGLAVIFAVAFGLAAGGSLSWLAELELQAKPLIAVALALQVLAFPSNVLPWSVGDAVATWLWVGSYGLLVLATVANRRLGGMLIVTAGMASNLVAVVVNGGHMPTLPGAAARVGMTEQLHNNSAALAHPHVALLVDRWAAPGWVPLANVFSIGDILLFIGAFAVVLPAMGLGLELRDPRAGDVADRHEPA